MERILVSEEMAQRQKELAAFAQELKDLTQQYEDKCKAWWDEAGTAHNLDLSSAPYQYELEDGKGYITEDDDPLTAMLNQLFKGE